MIVTSIMTMPFWSMAGGVALAVDESELSESVSEESEPSELASPLESDESLESAGVTGVVGTAAGAGADVESSDAGAGVLPMVLCQLCAN